MWWDTAVIKGVTNRLAPPSLSWFHSRDREGVNACQRVGAWEQQLLHKNKRNHHSASRKFFLPENSNNAQFLKTSVMRVADLIVQYRRTMFSKSCMLQEKGNRKAIMSVWLNDLKIETCLASLDIQIDWEKDQCKEIACILNYLFSQGICIPRCLREFRFHWTWLSPPAPPLCLHFRLLFLLIEVSCFFSTTIYLPPRAGTASAAQTAGVETFLAFLSWSVCLNSCISSVYSCLESISWFKLAVDWLLQKVHECAW